MSVQDIPTQQDEGLFVMSNQHDFFRQQRADGQLDLICASREDADPRDLRPRIPRGGRDPSSSTELPGITVRSAPVSISAGRFTTDFPVSRALQ